MGAGVGDENAESCAVVRPLRMPSRSAIGTQDAVFERVFTTNFMKFLTTFDDIFLTTIILTKHLVSVKSYNECYA